MKTKTIAEIKDQAIGAYVTLVNIPIKGIDQQLALALADARRSVDKVIQRCQRLETK